jgi:hypothetical protein
MQGKQPSEVSFYSGNGEKTYIARVHGEDTSKFSHEGSVL